MSRIHSSSSVALLPQFSLWSVPPTQQIVEKDIEYEVRPIATFSSSTPIRFKVKSPANEYVNFGESLLWIKLKVTLKSSAKTTLEVADWQKVTFVQNLMHSLFRSVSLSVNGQQIIHSPSLYAFKAYFESLLGYSKAAQQSHLASIGWELHPATFFDSKNPDHIELDLIGPLHLDLAHQSKALVGDTTFVLELIPNEQSYYVDCATDYTVQADFTDTCLYVHRSKVSDELVDAHNAAITKAPARYPFVRCEVRNMTIASGQADVILDNVVVGQMPRRMFIALLDNKHFVGEKPYEFKHFDLNYIVCYRDGIQNPTKAYTPNFKTKHYNREYLAFYRALNQNTTDPLISITKSEWEAKPVFGFNFAPDLSDGPSLDSHVNLRENGHLRVHLKFAEALKQATVALMYLEFDNCIEIDSLRNVHVDY